SIFEQQINQRTRNKYSVSNLKFRDKSDRVIVKMLVDAQKHINNSSHDKAYEILQEAHRLAPDYFEVARVMAFFHQKSGNLNDAREQYELAIVLSPNTPQLHFWFGKFMLHQEDNTDEALIHFEEAYKLDSDSVDVGLFLARCYMFKRQFDYSRNILNELKSKLDVNHEANYKVYLDTDIQILYRTADNLASIGEYSQAMDALEDMMVAFDQLPKKFKDRYMRIKLNKCEYTLSKIAKNGGNQLKGRAEAFRVWLNAESYN
ncbi:tetratricopeptide repeat protein, partial [Photobacterium indicum]|uniref:tetratricopeptide repeat protein n=1 Tax=Photobacterium indicum TaxID=81447 RepID=UPI003D0DD57B